jgi:hypothetical protein
MDFQKNNVEKQGLGLCDTCTRAGMLCPENTKRKYMSKCRLFIEGTQTTGISGIDNLPMSLGGARISAQNKICPSCGSNNIWIAGYGQRFQCSDCRKIFT